jgi:hypothetical protein
MTNMIGWEFSDQSKTMTTMNRNRNDDDTGKKVAAYFVLVGVEDVGKSSLMRQFIPMFEKKPEKKQSSEPDRTGFRSYCREAIYDNIVGTTRTLIDICLHSETKDFSKLGSHDSDQLKREIGNLTMRDITMLEEIKETCTLYGNRMASFEKMIKNVYSNAQMMLIIEIAAPLLRRNNAQQYIMKHVEKFCPYPEEEIPHSWRILYPGYPSSDRCTQITVPCENDTSIVVQDLRGCKWNSTYK